MTRDAKINQAEHGNGHEQNGNEFVPELNRHGGTPP
jgi:hypothetical protein